jgi:hypothetical protein
MLDVLRTLNYLELPEVYHLIEFDVSLNRCIGDLYIPAVLMVRCCDKVGKGGGSSAAGVAGLVGAISRNESAFDVSLPSGSLIFEAGKGGAGQGAICVFPLPTLAFDMTDA